MTFHTRTAFIVITAALRALAVTTSMVLAPGVLIAVAVTLTASIVFKVRALAKATSLVALELPRRRWGLQRSFALSVFLRVPLTRESRSVVSLATIFRSMSVSTAALAEWALAWAIVTLIQVGIGMPASSPLVVSPGAYLRPFVTLCRSFGRATITTTKPATIAVVVLATRS